MKKTNVLDQTKKTILEPRRVFKVKYSDGKQDRVLTFALDQIKEIIRESRGVFKIKHSDGRQDRFLIFASGNITTIISVDLVLSEKDDFPSLEQVISEAVDREG